MYLIFDTETTGLPLDRTAPAGDAWPRLVSISWQLMENEVTILEKDTYLIKPEGFTIPASAVKIHGITNKVATLRGVPLASALGAFERVCKKANILIAHNIEFDFKVLESAFLQAGLDFTLVANMLLYCTKEASKDILKIPTPEGKHKKLRLSELYRHFFNEDFENAHSSDADTAACARCFFELQKHVNVAG